MILLIALAAITFLDYYLSGFARRTFVFYNYDDGSAVVEERLLKRSDSRENDLIRYVEEVLLGPMAANSLPLFSKETKLESLLYRDEIVYLNLSENAAMAPPEGGEIYKNLKTLQDGIKRNFSYVGDLKFFIAGNAVDIPKEP